MKRVFLGIPIADHFTHDFKKEILNRNPDFNKNAKWLNAGNHHITVRFIGSVAPELLDELILSLETVIKKIKSFDVFTDKINHFVHAGVIVIDIKLHQDLQLLFNQVEKMMVQFNFLPEKREYHPHITLCRLKKNNHFHNAEMVITPKKIVVNELVLYESVSQEGESIYKAIHRFKLLA